MISLRSPTTSGRCVTRWTTSGWWSRRSSTSVRDWARWWWAGCSTSVRSRAPTRSASPSSTAAERSRSRSCAVPPTSRLGTGCRWRLSARSCRGLRDRQRKLRGVMSNGMLCSGKELGLTDDAAGLLILGDDEPGEPGTPIMEALGLRADTVFDITVEGNRPDAWCMSGIARDLAGRLELPFTLPEPPEPAPSGWPVEEAASASVDAADLCPRLTVSVLRHVDRGALTGLDRPAPVAGRHAPDQQRRRRVELRHARAGPADPSLRPVVAARARAERPPRPAGRDASRRSTACSARWGSRGGASATPARTA